MFPQVQLRTVEFPLDPLFCEPRDNARRASNLRLAFVGLAMVFTIFLGGGCASRDHMKIEQEFELSPGHKVVGYSIARASGGDIVIAGSNTLSNSMAWATRLDPTGKKRWEYIDGPAGSWTDYSSSGNSFYSAVDLPDGTLLCGVRSKNSRPTAYLVRLDNSGNVISRRELESRSATYPTGIRCLKWDGGVAVLSTVAGDPRATGWLTRLDVQGNTTWEKYNDRYGNIDAVTGPQENLYLICSDGHEEHVIRLDRTGNVLASAAIPGGPSRLMHPVAWSSHIYGGSNLLTNSFELLEFDLDLHLLEKVAAGDIAIKKGLELRDGSLIAFGSTYENGAHAAVARVSLHGGSQTNLLEAGNFSPWFDDAVPGDRLGEFITLRPAQGTTYISWILSN
jgi:hypothetical protein